MQGNIQLLTVLPYLDNPPPVIITDLMKIKWDSQVG